MSVNTLTRDSRIDEIIQLHVEDKAACGYFYDGGAPGWQLTQFLRRHHPWWQGEHVFQRRDWPHQD